jgi:nucleoside diphosphate kinase
MIDESLASQAPLSKPIEGEAMNVREYFFNRPNDFERSEYERLYAFISERISKAKLRLLPNISFVMFKPDAYLRGLIPALLNALKEEGIYIFRYRLKRLSESELDELYMFVKRKYSESWWVMKKVYSLAPCFLALVVGSRKGFQHLNARIREIVGPTTPIMGKENNLRYAFRGTHRVFNLIHATDDPASAIREALVFFSIDDIKQALEASTSEIIIIDEDFKWSELLPNKSIILNYNLAKNELKGQLLEFATNIMADSMSGEHAVLHRLIKRLSELVRIERRILEQELPLKAEYETLRMILHAERLALAILMREGRSAVRKSFRNDYVAETSKENITKKIVKILEICEHMLPLTDEVLFMSLPDVEVYLGRLLSMGIKFDLYMETLLLAGWAAAYNELLDVALDWPVERENLSG